MRKSRGFEVLDEMHSRGWTSAHLVETGRDLDTGEQHYSVKVEVPGFSLAGRAFDAVNIYMSEGLSEDQLLVTSYVDRSMEPAGDRVVQNVEDDSGAWDEVDRALHVVLELARYGTSELEDVTRCERCGSRDDIAEHDAFPGRVVTLCPTCRAYVSTALGDAMRDAMGEER